MTKPELKAVRRMIEASRGPSGRLPANARAEVLSAVARAHDVGMTHAAIAEALGVREAALQRWRWRERCSRAGKLVAVRVPQREASLIVHAPHGVRIEGLSLEDIATLITRLS
jgi:transposase